METTSTSRQLTQAIEQSRETITSPLYSNCSKTVETCHIYSRRACIIGGVGNPGCARCALKLERRRLRLPELLREPAGVGNSGMGQRHPGVLQLETRTHLARNSQCVPLLLPLPYCCRGPCHHQLHVRGRTARGARSDRVLSPTSMPETSPSKRSVASR